VNLHRLVYDFSIHGGGVGSHDLQQGFAYEHQIFWPTMLIYILSPMLTNTDFDLGSAAAPQLLLGNTDLTAFVTGQVHAQGVLPQESLVRSPWTITFNTAPETGGVIEFLFRPTHGYVHCPTGP
jgi:hypothetical protein